MIDGLCILLMYDILQDDINEVYTDDDADETENLSTEASVSVFTPLLKFLLTSLIVWQLTFSISNVAAIAIISIFKKFIFRLSDALGCESLRNATTCVPKTYNSILKLVGLECDFICSVSILQLCVQL